ncbi:hypothetical protein BCT56_03945 [Vibrio lentus]|uniref:Transposase n=1 Tax=Vibrio lentus TaxID=136468 RepID=A0AB36XL65_9VIBR|nr:hypothetical protein BCU51_09240 [Vibrio lentus]PMK29829.1 hypothetical protein BCU02_05720 [Vibrio lentus]PMK45915.1 hypothetical protein BCT99_22605 [Vibrio lentus]PML29231.1 hypothetical protein BCT79_05185 [Vibrio lentus]PMM40359.1 hypothetical protein BCT56_03945 [Vibrio lentus]
MKANVKCVSTTAVIGMEVCGSAHYWARELTSLDYDVKLIAAQFVKTCVKTTNQPPNKDVV